MQAARVSTAPDDGADWIGEQLAADTRWKRILTETEINGLLPMAASIRPDLGNNPDKLLALPRQAFDPGPFAARLETIAADLRHGAGIALVRGLPVEELDPIDVAIIYRGVGLYLGDAMPNNPEGDMFGHVSDMGKTQSEPNSRGYQTRETLDYHCDQSDIVGLDGRRCFRGRFGNGHRL